MSPEAAAIIKSQPLKPYDILYIEKAKQEHPEGKYCWQCGKINDNADDCGWWYKMIQGKFQALCRKCFPWEDHHGDR